MKLIPLTNSSKDVKVSDKDYEYLSQFNWQYQTTMGYVYSGRGYMHRIILERMGFDITGLVTDHLNRDKLDNRRSNLEAVTISENVRRSRPYYDYQRHWEERRKRFGSSGGDWKKMWETRRKRYGPSGQKAKL